MQFEGVSEIDNNYHLSYMNGYLVLIYPNQMVCIYQDNSFFTKRELDEIGGKLFNEIPEQPDGN